MKRKPVLQNTINQHVQKPQTTWCMSILKVQTSAEIILKKWSKLKSENQNPVWTSAKNIFSHLVVQLWWGWLVGVVNLGKRCCSTSAHEQFTEPKPTLNQSHKQESSLPSALTNKGHRKWDWAEHLAARAYACPLTIDKWCKLQPKRNKAVVWLLSNARTAISSSSSLMSSSPLLAEWFISMSSLVTSTFGTGSTRSVDSEDCCKIFPNYHQST